MKKFRILTVLLLLLGISFILIACQKSAPAPIPPEEQPSGDISLTDVAEVRLKAAQIEESFNNYSSFTATATFEGNTSELKVATVDDLKWKMATSEVEIDDEKMTYIEGTYAIDGAYVQYTKQIQGEQSLEEAIYVSEEDAKKQNYTDLVTNGFFDYFNPVKAEENRNLLLRHYGEAIPYIYNISYTKEGTTETLVLTTVIIEDYPPTYPVSSYTGTLTLADGKITSLSISLRVNDLCIDAGDEELNINYVVNITGINETTIARPTLSQTAKEYVKVNFFLGTQLIDTENYLLNSKITTIVTLAAYITKGDLNDVTSAAFKQKDSPTFEEEYVLDQKTTYNFEFVMMPNARINYVSNMEGVTVYPTYFNETATPNTNFDKAQEIVNNKCFAGWYEDKELTVPAKNSYEESITLYGKWSDAKYITIVVSGVNNFAMPKVLVNSYINSYLGFERGGKILEGFYTDNALLTKYTFPENPTEDITLYAKFVDSVFVTFDLDIDIPNSFKIDNYFQNAATVSGKTIIVNITKQKAQGQTFENVVNTAVNIIESFNYFGDLEYFTYNNAEFVVDQYPAAAITLKAQYTIPLSVKIDFGQAVMNTNALNALFKYTKSGNVYTIAINDIMADTSSLALELGVENTYSFALSALFYLFAYQNQEMLTVAEYPVVPPQGKAFSYYATTAAGETPADLSSIPAENSDDVIYAIYENESVVTLDAGGEMLGECFQSFYDDTSETYIVSSQKFSSVFTMEGFLELVTNWYTEFDFDNFTTDAAFENIYAASDWETITLYVKKVTSATLTFDVGGQNLDEMYLDNYDDVSGTYIFEMTIFTSTFDIFVQGITSSYTGADFDYWSYDADGEQAYVAADKWQTITLYAQFVAEP